MTGRNKINTEHLPTLYHDHDILLPELEQRIATPSHGCEGHPINIYIYTYISRYFRNLPLFIIHFYITSFEKLYRIFHQTYHIFFPQLYRIFFVFPGFSLEFKALRSRRSVISSPLEFN